MSSYVGLASSTPNYGNESATYTVINAGALLIMWYRTSTTGAVSTLTDSKGQSWTVDRSYTASPNGRIVIASCPNAATGSTTVTLTGTGGGYAAMTIMEFSDCGTASPALEGSTVNSSISGSSSWNSGNYTVTLTNDPVLIGETSGSDSAVLTQGGTGWAARGSWDINYTEGMSTKLPGATGVYSAAYTSTNFTGQCAILVYKGASAAGGGGQPMIKRFGGVPYAARNVGVW